MINFSKVVRLLLIHVAKLQTKSVSAKKIHELLRMIRLSCHVHEL